MEAAIRQFFTLRQILRWLSTFSVVGDMVRVCSNSPNKAYQAIFTRGQVRLVSARDTDSNPRFVIEFSETPAAYEGYGRIHASSGVHVFERTPDVDPLSMPLRFGLTLADANNLIQLARTAAADVLTRTSEATSMPEQYSRLSEGADIGVALWVDGSLRGSRIVFGEQAARATVQAARAAVNDDRFKPISLGELERATIEVIRISDLRLLHTSRSVDPTEAYQVVGFSSEDTAWYFPEVYNIRRFRKDEVLQSLARDKAGMRHYRLARYFKAEVDDWVETDNGAMKLSGPMLAPSALGTDTESLRRAAVEMGTRAVDHLIQVQEADGSFYLRLVTRTGERQGFDWSRLALSAWGLATFCEKGTPGYAAAESAADYVHAHEKQVLSQSASMTRTALSYMGNLYLAVGRFDDALRIGEILAQSASIALDPIADTQLISFFRRLKRNDLVLEKGVQDLSSLLAAQWAAYLSRSESQDDPALWAELLTLCGGELPDLYAELGTRILREQLSNGAFRSRIDYPPNTRGTGKILEVLATDPKRYAKALSLGVAWLSSMQYSQESMFFVPPKNRQLVRGGFRHDAFDTDAWIDAAGHALIMAARLSGKEV